MHFTYSHFILLSISYKNAFLRSLNTYVKNPVLIYFMQMLTGLWSVLQ